MAFDPNNPFGFTRWKQYYENGAEHSGNDIEAGNNNNADPNNATLVTVVAAENVALSVKNDETKSGSVGLVSESSSQAYGVGMVGVSRTGVGTYGVSNSGLGVVGRSMNGKDIEKEPLESLVPAVGVLGHAISGAGIRGHGGMGFSSPALEAEADPRPIGAVFSAGRLEDGTAPNMPTTKPKNMASEEPLAQIQLIPSTSGKLPENGRIGDLYLAMTEEEGAVLFVCTEFRTRGQRNLMIWRPVQLGAVLEGGQKI
ncbi:hypothetical protein PSAB6_460029 [Paraburkholderia sabiae]|uniref:hypothetical protein n=1 Tax=Paraburkholderia sabiae TaxID=273251 RepID=UPI001CB56C9E|nr:hypothetical protein [Paraburkholderia sabiae]CAG9226260.1 hypothetical protein PSAB6_460029 [Paraburkholderia sabiae]